MQHLQDTFSKKLWAWALVTVALILLLPLLSVGFIAVSVQSEVWTHLTQTVLGEYLTNSFLLSLFVAIGVILIGVPTAWLTAIYEFPGRKLLTWLLLLPLAMPAYIIAYTYTGIFDVAGPVQNLIRDMTGLSYGEYWFFEMRSLGGAIMMMSLVLYPYVYLLSRVAFIEQSQSVMEAGQTLGLSNRYLFLRIALPMARPAIYGGTILAVMETLADYGTVQYFGIGTFTTGIFRTFYGFKDQGAAAQLSVTLLCFVIVLLLMENRLRKQRKFYNEQGSSRKERLQLTPALKIFAVIICALPVFLGFLFPSLFLVYWSISVAEFDPKYFEIIWNTVSVAFITAVLVTMLAVVFICAKRLYPSRWVRAGVNLMSMGYALPGTIIAIGLIIPLTRLDNYLYDFWQQFDITWSAFLSGSIAALIFAYSVRFLAVALNSIQSGSEKIKPSLDDASTLMGQTGFTMIRKVHLPMLKGSMLTAFLIVFVDTMKELPATLILRPFNFNTLAVRAYELAADERLQSAAPVSLTIVVVGLIPVILLNRSIDRQNETL